MLRRVFACLVCVAALAGQALAQIDIAQRRTPYLEVRFASGQAVYVEGLLGGRWEGRYWSANGGVGNTGRFWESDAFEIRVKGQPMRPYGQFLTAFTRSTQS